MREKFHENKERGKALSSCPEAAFYPVRKRFSGLKYFFKITTSLFFFLSLKLSSFLSLFI
jgi:hypothetical protein